MLEVASARVADLVPDEAAYARAYAALPLWRRRKCDAHRSAAGRFESAAAGLLLLRLAARVGHDLSALDAVEGADGKPAYPTLPGFHFSLSHAKDRVLVAVSDRPVGCDVERVRAPSPELLAACLAPAERAAWDRGAFAAPEAAAFIRLWVRKESVVKARGTGFAVDPNTVEVLSDLLPGGLRLHDVDFGDGTLGAVATYGADVPRFMI